MRNNDTYKVKMTQEDCLKAINNFLAARKIKVKNKRVKAIHELLSPSQGTFLFWKYAKKPECKNVKEAIKYLKNHSPHEFIKTSYWDGLNYEGLFWKTKAEELLNILERKSISGDIELYGEMSFIATWL